MGNKISSLLSCTKKVVDATVELNVGNTENMNVQRRHSPSKALLRPPKLARSVTRDQTISFSTSK